MLDQLLAYSGAVTNVHDLRVVFGCCEPHLLSLYLKMGQRTYAPHNINSPSAGYLIPLVTFVPDVEALRGVGPDTAPGELPACVEAVLAPGVSVRSEVLSAPDEYWSEIRHTLDELDAQQISTFDGFTDDEAQRCIARSTIIECAAGDRVLKRGGTARNIFVVLDGTLEVRDGDTIVNVLTRRRRVRRDGVPPRTPPLLRRRRRHRRHPDPEPQRRRAPQDDRRGRDHRRQAAAQPLADALRETHPSQLSSPVSQESDRTKSAHVSTQRSQTADRVVVAHALDLDVARAGNQLGGATTAARIDQRVAIAVHDECRDVQRAQVRRRDRRRA